MSNRWQQLDEFGVSVWLDDLGRQRLVSGELQRLVDEGVRGVTTNPTIFAKAIGDGSHYRDDLVVLARQGVDRDQAVRSLVVADVVAACDVLAPVHRATGGVDGRVSIEVDPRLARDTAATVAEARELWQTVDRPNVMIKVPATAEGLPAVTTLLAEGISVNVTLIFALQRYREVLDAWLAGLEAAARAGHDLSTIESVASFFVSRFDTLVDPMLGPDHVSLQGRAAVANARLAYRDFAQTLAGERWQRLAGAGAHVQRPLWASTSTKNPDYPDTLYVDGLMAPHTVNTMPAATLEAVRDHGAQPSDTVTGAYDEAQQTMADLAAAGLDYDALARTLEEQGVASFSESWEQLLAAVGAALDVAAAAS
jgi:transaldolase